MLTQASYIDLYLSTIRDAPAFFGGTSVVIQTSNKMNIACAAFKTNGSPVSGSAGALSAMGNIPALTPVPSSSGTNAMVGPSALSNAANRFPLGQASRQIRPLLLGLRAARFHPSRRRILPLPLSLHPHLREAHQLRQRLHQRATLQQRHPLQLPRPA